MQMKKIIHAIMIFAAVSLITTSCEDMNSIHQEFLDRGERVYIGIPQLLEANSGLGRVELVWAQNADPRIHETRIFWNNRQDSIVVPIDRTQPIMYQAIPLPEGRHILEIANASRTGYRSLFTTTSAESFGERFQNTLRNRVITRIQVEPDNSITLTWSMIEGVVSTNMSYVNRNGENITISIASDQTTLHLSDFVPGGEFTHSSLYLPHGSIDYIPSNPVTVRFPSYVIVRLNRANWELANYPPTAGSPGADWHVTNIIMDNNRGWHTPWTAPMPQPPFTLDIDMQQVHSISSVVLALRQRANADFYLSEDGVAWTRVGSIVSGITDDAITGHPGLMRSIQLEDPVDAKYIRMVVTAGRGDGAAVLWDIFAYAEVRL